MNGYEEKVRIREMGDGWGYIKSPEKRKGDSWKSCRERAPRSYLTHSPLRDRWH